MFYAIRQIFLKGGTIKDAIHYVFKATGKMPTKSEGMKIINVYQDVQKHSGDVIQFPKERITPFHTPRPTEAELKAKMIKENRSNVQKSYLRQLDEKIRDEMEITVKEMDSMSSTALDDLRRNADPQGMQKHFDEITEGRGVGDFPDDPNFLKDDYASGGIARVGMFKGKLAKWLLSLGKKPKPKIKKDRLATADELEDYIETLDPTGEAGVVEEGMTIRQLDDMVTEHKAYMADMKSQYMRGDLDKYVKPEVLEEQRLFRQKKIDKVLDKAYDEVFYQKPVSGDYKYDADILSDSIAEQLGKGAFTDLPQTHQTQIYNTALKRVTKDLQINRAKKIAEKNLTDLEQKIELQMFDPKDKIPHASGGIAGQLHLNEGGRVPFLFGGSGIRNLLKWWAKRRSKEGLKGSVWPDKPSAEMKNLMSAGEKETYSQKRIEWIETILAGLKKDKELVEHLGKTEKMGDPGLDFMMGHFKKSFDETGRLGKYKNIDKDIMDMEMILKNLKTKGRKLNAEGGLAHVLGV